MSSDCDESSQEHNSDEENKLEKEIEKAKLQLNMYKQFHDALLFTNNQFTYAIRSLINATEINHEIIANLSKASLAGNKYASFILAFLTEKTSKTQQDINTAIELYQRAADQGNPKGYNSIGRILYNGEILKSDYTKAIECFKKAAEQGDSVAYSNLGIAYLFGQGCQKDISKAIEFNIKCSELGCYIGYQNIGIYYEEGEYVEKDYAKSIDYYKKAADLGSSLACYKLGLFYEKGEHIEKDLNKAFRYYEQSSNDRNINATYRLGLFYKNGIVVERNVYKATELFNKAAEGGDIDACDKMGDCYHFGICVEKNYEKAAYYYFKAEKENVTNSIIHIGLYHEYGIGGLNKSITDAQNMYKRAIDLGDPSGYYYIGAMYESGDNVKQDYKIAKEYFKKAVAHNNCKGLVALGDMYQKKKGSLFRKYKKAFECFQKAADMNYPEAVFRLSILYEYGCGIFKSCLRS